MNTSERFSEPTPRRRKRGPGRPRTRALALKRIRSEALRIIDEEGMAALSMRRLAAALDVDPMSIYHYVANKDALLDAVIEHVVHEHAFTDNLRASWLDRVRSWARQYRALVMAHPRLVLALVADAAAASRFAPATLEPLYRALAEGGLGAAELIDVADTLVDHVHGFVLAESAQAGGFDRAAFLTAADQGRSPTVAEVLGTLAPDELRYDFDAGFDRGLEVILTGIDRYRRPA
jgi:TetR/AcrR family transcriptional regulator, tetracycline repressor protein